MVTDFAMFFSLLGYHTLTNMLFGFYFCHSYKEDGRTFKEERDGVNCQVRMIKTQLLMEISGEKNHPDKSASSRFPINNR